MARTAFVLSVAVLWTVLSAVAVLGSRIVGGDGVVYHFHGREDRDFCFVSDPSLHVNAHMIGRKHDTQTLTWIGGLAIMWGDSHLYIDAFPEATWDPFLDHLDFKFNGQSLHIPAPGIKAGPHASPGSWESLENKIRITRRRVNEARIEIEGVLDLRLKADTVQKDWWTEDNCFVHLDMEFRHLAVSSSVHGVLGQTYRPQRIKAAKLRALRNSEDSGAVDLAVLGSIKGPAIVGKVGDYISSGLWAADCKYSKFHPRAAASSSLERSEMSEDSVSQSVGGVTGLKNMRGGLPNGPEEVNPLEAYFSENAVRVIRRSKVSSEIGEAMSPDAFADSDSSEADGEALADDEAYIVEIEEATEGGSQVDGSDTDNLLLGTSLEKLMNE